MLRRTGPSAPSTASASVEPATTQAPSEPAAGGPHRHGPSCGCSGFATPTAAPTVGLTGQRPPERPALTPRAWLDSVFGKKANQQPYADEFEAVKANAQFKALPAALQANLLEELGRHAPWTQGRQMVALLGRYGGLAGLPQAKAQQVINLIGGTTRTSTHARDELAKRLADSALWKAAPAVQADVLSKFLEDPTSYPPLSAGAPAKLPGPQQVSMEGPVEVASQPFRPGAEPALRYDVRVGMHRVPVFVPKTPVRAGLHQHTLMQVAQALAQLPSGLLSRIPFITLEAKPNPGDDYWKLNFANFKGSYLTADASSVAIHPTEEPQSIDALASALVHEAGHVVSYSEWGLSAADERWKPWRDAVTKDVVLPSAYAANRVGEDFSETLRAYYAVRGTPAQAELDVLFAGRVAVLKQLALA